MRRTLSRIAPAIAALAFALSPASAALTPGQTAEAEAAMRDFTALEFAVRQQAVETLIALGPDVVPLVRKTLAGTTDAEVRLRCEMTLRGLRERFGPAAIGETPAAGAVNFDATKVTIDVKGAPLTGVLDEFRLQTGNTPPGAPDGRPVTFAVKDLGYWEALDRLAAQLGMLVGRQGWVERPPDTRDIRAYAGPLVVWVVSGERVRRFSAYASAGPLSRDHLAYRIYWQWENRLQVLKSSGQVTSAKAADGRALRIGKVDDQHNALEVLLDEDAAGLKELAEIEGWVRLDVSGGEEALTASDILGGKEQTAADGDVSFTVKSAQKTERGIAVTIECSDSARPSADPRTPGRAGSRYLLVGPDGKRYLGRVMNLRSLRPDATGRSGATVQFLFTGLPEVPGAWSLTYVTPGEPVSRQFPFRFTHIPIP